MIGQEEGGQKVVTTDKGLDIIFGKPSEEEQEAQERHEKVIRYRNLAVATFFGLGEELYWIEKKKLYELLGHTSFNAYLASPEVDISRNVAFQLKRVYNTFFLDMDIEPETLLLEAGYSKLDVIRPYVTEENAMELINMAGALSRSNLRTTMREMYDGKTIESCQQHNEEKCPIFQDYKSCGRYAEGNCPEVVVIDVGVEDD